jgi:hypothetical protein
MTDVEPEQTKRERDKRHLIARWRLAVAACLVVLAGTGLLFLARPGRSLEARLRAIDAAYAIPDEENAAGAYTELAWDDTGPSLDPSILSANVRGATCAQSWRSAEYPQVVKWLEERRPVIDTLIDTSRKPNCRFSVWEARWQAGRRADAAPQWTNLLLQAANNDLAEGHAEAGLEKLLCILQMARHFSTQIDLWDNRTGRAILSAGLHRIDRLVVMEDVPQEWLARLETALPPAENGWNENARQVEEVMWLYQQEEQRGIIQRLKSMFTRAKTSKMSRESELLELGRCRVARILLGLRRYRNETGAWPASLREIEGRVPSKALIDPLSTEPFAYRVSETGVLVYSVGLNGVDEGGTSVTGGRAGDDFLFWPR